MKKSIIQRMREEKVQSWSATNARTLLRRYEWEVDWETSGKRRWCVSGTVFLPSGLAVEVWSGGTVGDRAAQDISVSLVYRRRKYFQYIRGVGSDSKVTLQRLAVAFAERVTGVARD